MPDITDPEYRHEQRIDERTLRVTRRSSFSDQVHTLDLPITQAEWERWQEGRALIQEALPSLTNPQREFLLTGTTQEEWLAAFPPEDDDSCEGGVHCCCGPAEACCDCGQSVPTSPLQ